MSQSINIYTLQQRVEDTGRQIKELIQFCKEYQQNMEAIKQTFRENFERSLEERLRGLK